MVWDNLENLVADEFESLDSTGKLSFMKCRETQKVYDGNSSRLYRSIKDDTILHRIADHDTYGNSISIVQCPTCGHTRKYTQTTLRSAMYIREMQRCFELEEVKWLTDFGPGYGGFVRVWNILYPHTDFYQLIDLPRLKQISEYYLEKYGIRTKTHVSLEQHVNPHHHGGKSLFVASHSLNECNMKVREQVERILPKYDWIYIVYNQFFGVNGEGKIDNIDYFYELGERLKETHNVHQYFEPVTAKWRLVAKI